MADEGTVEVARGALVAVKHMTGEAMTGIEVTAEEAVIEGTTDGETMDEATRETIDATLGDMPMKGIVTEGRDVVRRQTIKRKALTCLRTQVVLLAQ